MKFKKYHLNSLFCLLCRNAFEYLVLKNRFLKYFILFLLMCIYDCLWECVCRCPRRPDKDAEVPGNGATGGCKPPEVGGNLTQVL